MTCKICSAKQPSWKDGKKIAGGFNPRKVILSKPASRRDCREFENQYVDNSYLARLNALLSLRDADKMGLSNQALKRLAIFPLSRWDNSKQTQIFLNSTALGRCPPPGDESEQTSPGLICYAPSELGKHRFHRYLLLKLALMGFQPPQ